MIINTIILAAMYFISFFLGDPEYGIPNMIPLKFPFMNIISTPSMSLNFTNVEVHGLDKMKLISHKWVCIIEVNFLKYPKNSLSWYWLWNAYKYVTKWGRIIKISILFLLFKALFCVYVIEIGCWEYSFFNTFEECSFFVE